jgi:hypothetical protein
VSAAALGKGVAGFVLGALLSIFMPPLAFALALVLGGILLWARWRHQDVQPVAALAAGFLVAVSAYVGLAALAVVSA